MLNKRFEHLKSGLSNSGEVLVTGTSNLGQHFLSRSCRNYHIKFETDEVKIAKFKLNSLVSGSEVDRKITGYQVNHSDYRKFKYFGDKTGQNLNLYLFSFSTNEVRYFRGTVLNFNQPEARKQCYLAFHWLKFGTLPQNYRTQYTTKTNQ